MKYLLFTFVALFSKTVIAQKIEIPPGITYTYCDSLTLEKAKDLIKKELGDAPTYDLGRTVVFIGPGLWERFKNVKAVSDIKGGDMTINWIGGQKLKGKATSKPEDFKIIWDNLRSEIRGQDYIIRKANVPELRYYWSIISFDIDEPLLIVQTKDHNYLIDLGPTDLKLDWLDEVTGR